MKVVFAPHAYSPAIGGAESYTEGLASGLATRGHEVHVVVADVTSPEAFYEVGHSSVGVERESLDGVEVHRIEFVTLGYSMLGKAGLQSWAITSARRRFRMGLRDELVRLKPDCVVTLPHLFPNVEEVVRLRGDGEWKVIYAPMLHEHDPYWSIDRVSAAVSRADGLIALTEHERVRLLTSYGADPETTMVIPPGVEAPSDRSAFSSERKLEILYLGRRTAGKRLDVLLDAMRQVWEARPDVNLVIAGPTPQRGKDPVSEVMLDRRVRVIDNPSDEAKSALLGSSFVLVNPSTTESFGITTLESWAHSTPVVLADSPVSRSVVQHELDGVLFPGDAASLASVLTRLLQCPSEVTRMGAHGRRRAEAEFSWQRSARLLETLALSVTEHGEVER